MAQKLWEIEGDLLQVQMKIDKLKKEDNLSEENRAELQDLEKRRDILNKQLRKERMKS